MREPGFSNDNSLDVSVIPRTGLGEGQVNFKRSNDVIQSIGDGAIGQMLQNKQAAEFPLTGLPKYFEVYNRAQKGNVKIWAQGFNSVMYPENATEDRTTWLQPGETMNLPIEAILHFFGNIFAPTFEGACAVIEACGGFETEARSEMIADWKNIAPPRIVGGPLFLPDFIIRAKDGRNKQVGGEFELYEVYDRLTRRLRKNRILTNKALINQESELLEERLAEYRTADIGIYDQYGAPIVQKTATEEIDQSCDCSPIAHVKGVQGCAHAKVPTRPRKRGRPRIVDEDTVEDLAEEQDIIAS